MFDPITLKLTVDPLIESALKEDVTSEDVTEKLSEYGTLDESEIQAIRDRTERSQKPTEPNMPDSGSSTNENPQNTAITTTSDAVHEEQGEETAEVKKFVICPKCGEKIWL